MTPLVDPYEAVLGDAFDSLHPDVRRAHRPPLTATGTVDVDHGRHWAAPLIIRAMALPRAGRGVAVCLDVRATPDGVEWMRSIGSFPLRTLQTAAGGRLVERSGLGRVVFDLSVADGSLLYRQHAMTVAGWPVPDFVSPRVSASVAPDAGSWRVDVTVTWRGHLVCRYGGRIRAT